MDIEDFNFKTTIVSFYFDITKLKDVTNKIRPKSFYMEKGRQLLHLPYPMVLFCDNITINEIKHIREQELGIDIANKLTYYIIKNIIDYDLYKDNWNIIIDNRKSNTHYIGSRNTPSYFLICMFKINALHLANQLNYFNTSHFAWIDFGGSHVMRDFDNATRKMLDNPLEKIRFCYIHYRSKDELLNMKEWYSGGGKCGIAGGAFTVQKEYVSKLYNGMFSIFHETLLCGIGHAEEQILTYFNNRYPELCNYYYGDYYSILTNYHEPIEDIKSIIKYYIDNAYKCGRNDLAINCEKAIYNVSLQNKSYTDQKENETKPIYHL